MSDKNLAEQQETQLKQVESFYNAFVSNLKKSYC